MNKDWVLEGSHDDVEGGGACRCPPRSPDAPQRQASKSRSWGGTEPPALSARTEESGPTETVWGTQAIPLSVRCTRTHGAGPSLLHPDRDSEDLNTPTCHAQPSAGGRGRAGTGGLPSPPCHSSGVTLQGESCMEVGQTLSLPRRPAIMTLTTPAHPAGIRAAWLLPAAQGTEAILLGLEGAWCSQGRSTGEKLGSLRMGGCFAKTGFLGGEGGWRIENKDFGQRLRKD